MNEVHRLTSLRSPEGVGSDHAPDTSFDSDPPTSAVVRNLHLQRGQVTNGFLICVNLNFIH